MAMDANLIEAINDMILGKEEGFNKVYSATYNHVYFHAKAQVGSEEDAKDLVQIVFIEAYKSIGTLENANAFYGWLDGITRFQGLKMLRKKRDVLLDEEAEGIFDTIESEDIDTMPELSSDQKETSRIIKEVIDELPESQRMALIAYYFDNYSVGQIAEMEECSEGTIKSRLNYARKYLKDRIEEKERKEGYRLHAFALPLVWWAIKMLADETVMSLETAQQVYNEAYYKVGLVPETLAIAGNSVGSATVTVASTTAVTSAGLSTGMKALIIAGAILVGGGAVAGGVAVVNHIIEENSVSSGRDRDRDRDTEKTENQDKDEFFGVGHGVTERDETVAQNYSALAGEFAGEAALASDGQVYIDDVNSDGTPELIVLKYTDSFEYIYEVYYSGDDGIYLGNSFSGYHVEKLFGYTNQYGIAAEEYMMGIETVYYYDLKHNNPAVNIFDYTMTIADGDYKEHFVMNTSMYEMVPLSDVSEKGILEFLNENY